MAEILAPLGAWVERIGAEASILTLVLILGYFPLGWAYLRSLRRLDAINERTISVMVETAGAIEALTASVTEARHEHAEHRRVVHEVLLALATGRRSDVPS